MKKRIFLATIIGTLMFGTAALFAQDSQVGNGANGNGQGPDEPRMAGIHWAKGQAPTGQAGSSPNLSYHGGPVVSTDSTGTGINVYPIYWGTSWGSTTFQGDKINGLGTFYQGLNGSTYAGTNTEYTDSTGSHVTTAFSVHNISAAIDTSKTTSNFNITTPILQEVCKVYPKPDPKGYYPVYVDAKRGNKGFCAWHSYGTCNGVTIPFAFFFNLDGDPGCDPQDPGTIHSQGLEALANVSGHEISETVTDIKLNAWYDSTGSENADKCAWKFGPNPLSIGGQDWKVQGNWSNAAYTGGQGYKNGGTKVVGCIDGTNPTN